MTSELSLETDLIERVAYVLWRQNDDVNYDWSGWIGEGEGCKVFYRYRARQYMDEVYTLSTRANPPASP